MARNIMEGKVNIPNNTIIHAMEGEFKLEVEESLDDLAKVRTQVMKEAEEALKDWKMD
jgi:hypothetical protein